MDTFSKEIVRVDRLATGGEEDGLAYGTHKRNVLDHCGPAEYVPELLTTPLRTDIKPLNVIQPEGPSFQIEGNLIKWQNWRFRLGFNPREGATLHDVRYNGRSVLYRLSLSEMTVPYGDVSLFFRFESICKVKLSLLERSGQSWHSIASELPKHSIMNFCLYFDFGWKL